MIQNRHLMKRLLPLDDTESTNRRYADCHLTIRKLPSDDTVLPSFVLKTRLYTHYTLTTYSLHEEGVGVDRKWDSL